LRFPRKPLRGAVNGMTWPPCSIGSGTQSCPVDQSIHIVRAGVKWSYEDVLLPDL
jgi:hypothetical protein